jgi:hypothetical protein
MTTSRSTRSHIRHRGAVTKGPGLVTHVIEGRESEIEEDLFLFNLTLVGHRVLFSFLKIEKFQV